MTFTVADYLLRRLESLGVDHLFGIPGDYILPLFESFKNSKVAHIATCNELNAGYAADGYARLRGLGAVAVTYGPGSLSVVNATAGAFAEGVPLLVISGGPVRSAYQTTPILHHVLPGKFDASLKIFQQVTAHARILDDPEQATADIDEALNICLSQRKPVYLEIPRDVQTQACEPPDNRVFVRGIRSDAAALEGAVEFLRQRIAGSRRTVLLPGHEIQHAGIESAVTELVDRAGLYAASMFIGKADFLEQHARCIGAYQGAGSPPEVRDFVEGADTVIFLGCVPSDFNLGGFTARLDDDQVVHVFDNRVAAGATCFEQVSISDLVDRLLATLPARDVAREVAEEAAQGATCTVAPVRAFSHRARNDYEADTGAPLTNKRFYDRMASFFRTGDIVLADAGCAVNATQVQLPAKTRYIASCYWASIGMGFAATLGACLAAGPGRRVIALEGDGSFQMTAQELSSMARYNQSPIVFVVNNRGYTAERLIHDGAFNDIANWKYHLLPLALGGVQGEDVHTEGGLERALARAGEHKDGGPLLIEVHIDPWDASEAFKLMSAALRSR